jgi:hypothetical protein
LFHDYNKNYLFYHHSTWQYLVVRGFDIWYCVWSLNLSIYHLIFDTVFVRLF